MTCDQCGSEMVLRTARRGKNAGKQFWGCSNYPKCKNTRAVKENSNSIGIDAKENKYREYDLPVFLKAREKYKNYQVRFFETIAIPIEFIDLLNSERLEKRQFRKINQWRIDYPNNPNSFLDLEIKKVLLVAAKILTRGKVTLISSMIESSLRDLFNIDDGTLSSLKLDKIPNYVSKTGEHKFWFDGFGTEEKFYNKNLPEVLGPFFYQFVVPQVDVSNLVDDESFFNQRVDFLVSDGDTSIIVELEGEEHSAHREKDNARKAKLSDNGYEFFSIDNYEIEKENGPNLEAFNQACYKLNITNGNDFDHNELYLLSSKIIHQIQVSIIEVLLNSFVDITIPVKIFIDSNSLLLKEDLQKKLFEICRADIVEFLNNLAELYGFNIAFDNIEILPFNEINKEDKQNSIVITYNDNLQTILPKFIIQEVTFPFSITQLGRPEEYAIINHTQKENVKYFLKYIFRHEDFLEGQFEAIERALKGEDSIVLLPTGAGKSVAFQLASLLLPGISIVIDPLISLIDDQIDNLNGIGIDRAIGITSQITNPEERTKIISVFGQGEYLFCYIAPERFETIEFRETLRSLTTSTPIALISIDEAHCVSEWGHDFRTSYLNIGRTSRKYCQNQDNSTPPLLALTGTASHSVLRDVQRELEIESYDSIITPKTFDRKELNFNILFSESNEKFNVLKGVLQRNLPEEFNNSPFSFFQEKGKATNAGIIFFPHVRGTHGVVENADLLQKELGINVKYYGGKKPKAWNNTIKWKQYKKTTAHEFKHNKFPLLASTKSFGMGIDKPNIRYTIHYGLPPSIEAFYQEAGRAGRDRRKAKCIVVVSNDYPDRSSRILEPKTSIEEINEILQKEKNRDNDDDITRAIYFHVNSFKGVSREVEDIRNIISHISDLKKPRKESFRFNKINRNSVEKSIHRLLILGVVNDYTINYSSEEFTISFGGITKNKIIDNYSRYVSGYNKGRVVTERNKITKLLNNEFNTFVIEASRVLVEFIYNTIEKGRRRALREMLSLAEAVKKTNDKDSIIRERILRYLETSYSEEIETIRQEENTFSNLKKLFDGEVVTETGEIIGGIRSTKDVLEIRGQTVRALESNPDQPGLLLLRAITEIFSPDTEEEIVIQNINAAVKYASEEYSIQENVLYDILIWTFQKIPIEKIEIYENVLIELYKKFNDENFLRGIINSENTNDELIYTPALLLFHNYSERITNNYQFPGE